jgi:hypothetical protein
MTAPAVDPSASGAPFAGPTAFAWEGEADRSPVAAVYPEANTRAAYC